VTVALVLGAAPAAAFDDVPSTNPFVEEITWLADHGIATGYEDGTFRPTLPVSRQAMAGFLQRAYVELGGVLEPSYPDPGFTDVTADDPFYDEIAWLVDADLAIGFQDGTFHPTRPVSRQAMAGFLFRFWILLEGGLELSYPDPGYSDVPIDAPFGHAIWWLAHEEIASGFDDGTFRPTLAVSRQAMAALLQRFDEEARQIGEPDFVVDTATDAVDTDPGDGACVAEGGGCTLRAAIGESNALFGRQVVVLDVDPVLTLTGAEPTPDNAVNDVDIAGDLELQGDGHLITGAGLGVASGRAQIYRVEVLSGIQNDSWLEVTESTVGDLTSDGTLYALSSHFPSGNLWIEGFASLHDLLIEGGRAGDLPEMGGGGVHFEDGEVFIVGSLIRDNVSEQVGGGVQAVDANVTIIDSEILDNSIDCDCGTGSAGGVSMVRSNLTMIRTTVSGNRAPGDGGGIALAGGSVHIHRSTISDNEGATGGEVGEGGGIRLSGAVARITLSTISGNDLAGTHGGEGGGGIYVVGGILDVLASTIADNVGEEGDLLPADAGQQIVASGSADVSLLGTVLDQDDVDHPACRTFLSATIQSEGHNASADATCGLTEPTDQPATDPLLGPLADNGGPTLTHLPDVGSPLLDHIPATESLCVGPAWAEDQRLLPRPQGSGCDVGAVERQPSPSP
jgi:CSLREA domain-containing protein